MDKQQRHAWIIAGTLFIILFFVWGATYNTTPLFVGAFLKSFGWSHAQVAWIPSIIALSVGITGPVAGWLLDRIEARNVMGAGAVLVAIGLVMASRSNSFAELIFANVVLGIGLGASTWVPSATVIANWFGERRGTVLGLATAGMETGGMVMVFIVGYVIAHYSWRAAYLLVSIPTLVLMLPLIVMVVQTRPQSSSGRTVADAAKALPGYEFADAVRMPSYWLLLVTNFLWGFSAAGVFTHIVAYQVDIGYSEHFATNVVAIILGLTAIGKPSMGALADRVGGKGILGLGLIITGTGFLTLLGFRHGWVVAPAIVLIGFTLAAPVGLMPMVLAETFGLKRFGSLMGWLGLIFTFGLFSGPLMVGRMFDAFGSYTPAYEMCAAASILAGFLAFLCAAPEPSLWTRSVESEDVQIRAD
jgi:MFS family permease